LLLTGCSEPTISSLRRNPEDYRNTSVTLEGQITGDMTQPKTGAKFVQLDDGSGEIWVLMVAGTPPHVGAQVKVTGTLQTGIEVGGVVFQLLLQADKADVLEQAESGE